MIRRVRRLLAERSPRGRAASWALAAVAIVGVLVALYLLFPRREDPQLRVGLATADPTLQYATPLQVWPGLRVRVAADQLTRGADARVSIRERTLVMVTTSPDGQLDAVVALPADLAPGDASLRVEDGGSGRVLEAQLQIRDPRTPGVVLQPARATAGDAVAVSAGGLPPGVQANVVLDPAGSRQLLREGRTTRDGVLLLVVLLPPDLQPGDYAVGVARPAGTALAPPAPLEVTP